jgi:predicted PurR-regulated permease PerM
VAAIANTIASADRNESLTSPRCASETVRVAPAIGSYDTHVPDAGAGPPAAGTTPNGESSTRERRAAIDVDPRSAIPLAVAFAALLISVWFVRSVPRMVTTLAVGALIALALNPLVEALQRRTSWRRRDASAVVLTAFAIVFVAGLTLIAVPTVQQVRTLDDDVPELVQELEELPIVGGQLRDANASDEVEEWLDELPERLSVDTTPLEDAANSIADGVAAAFLTLLFAITLLVDGEYLVNNVKHLVPASRRPTAERLGTLVYAVIGKYIAGSLFVAGLAGVVMLAASLALDVPLAPLIGAWVAMTNMIPQIGGFLGAVPFVLFGATRGAGTAIACLVIFLIYQNIENHFLQPVIVGKAVHLSPPATMIAALVGVTVGGVVGALFAVPILGASKAVYLAVRDERAPPGAAPEPAKNAR